MLLVLAIGTSKAAQSLTSNTIRPEISAQKKQPLRGCFFDLYPESCQASDQGILGSGLYSCIFYDLPVFLQQALILSCPCLKLSCRAAQRRDIPSRHSGKFG